MQDEQIRDFVTRDYQRVLRAVTAVCGDRHRAEDAVQEAIVDAWAKRRDVDDLAGWVTVAAMNRSRSRSRWRSQAAERRAIERLARLDRGGPAESERVPDQQLAAALAKLPRAQREIVALHYLIDLSVASVAESLGIAEGTVKAQLHRGRAALREALADPPVASGATPAVREADIARDEGEHVR